MTSKRPSSVVKPAPRGPGRPPRDAATERPGPRERLLSSAATLFAAKGIAAVGLDELTKHAAVARMSLYQHFQNKEGLVAAYLRERHDAWMAWMKSEGAKFADPRERLLSIFDTLAAWHRMDDYHGCPFARAAGELGAGEGAVKDAMDEHAAEVMVWLEGLSREAGHPDPAALASKLVILINGANLCAARGGEHERSAALARSMVEMLLRESAG
jgi:AcrR family transcriptional regulator